MDLEKNGYLDLWKATKPNSPGFTFKKSEDFDAWRPDRIFVKSNMHYDVLDMQIIGDYPLPIYTNGSKKPKQYEIITPSDHMGIYVQISFKNSSQYQSQAEKADSQQQEQSTLTNPDAQGQKATNQSPSLMAKKLKSYNPT